MTALITDPELERELIARRRASGGDKYDEVWEGVYVMSPLANDEHQFLVKELTMVLGLAVDWAGLGQTRPGVNIGNRRDQWQHDYRVPDVAVFLNDTTAENCGAFWFGGPDLAIEIVSPGDRTREKLPFYADVGTRELLVIDRDPWHLSLFRLREKQMVQVGSSTFESSSTLASEVVPLAWQLTGQPRGPEIKISHQDGKQAWQVKVAIS